MKKFNLAKGLVIGLLTLALCLTCFGYVKASAEEAEAPSEVSATYDATNDTVVAAAKTVVYVVKAASGNKIKAGAACFTMSKATINIADLGIKNAKKDVYLYTCDKEVAEGEITVNATLVIKAQAAKKIVGSIDYTKVDSATATDVLSAVCTDSNGKEIENPVIKWSADGSKWEDSTTFNGAKLVKMLEDGGGIIYIKQVGTSGGTGEAVFSSAAVKTKIAKQPKAVAVKMDVKKGTFALKNGFDFGVATVSGKKVTAPAVWHTILPKDKSASTSGLDNSIATTAKYKPMNKKATNALKAITDREDGMVSYTKTAIKALSFEAVANVLAFDAGKASGDALLKSGFTIAFRKSATDKKPASAISYATVAAKTEAPLVLTYEKVAGQYIVSTGDSFDKGLITGEVANYPGTSGNPKVLATTGFWNTFKIGKAGNKDADGNAASYEYAIVKTENLFVLQSDADAVANDSIDWATVKWAKFAAGKTKFTAKTKTKYSTTGGKAVEATLKAGAPDVGSTDPVVYLNGVASSVINNDVGQTAFKADFETAIIIRRAGVKGKTIDDSVMASDYVVLFVAKVDKTFYLVSTEDMGAQANKYTVKFSKWMEDDPSTDADDTDGYYVDSTISEIYGWQLKNTEVKVSLPALSGAEYEKAAGKMTSTTNELINGNLIYAHITGTPEINSKNELVFKTENADEDSVITVPVKVWANIEIIAKIEGDKEATKALYTVKDGKVVVILKADGDSEKVSPAPTAATVFVGDSTGTFSKSFKTPEINKFNIYLDVETCNSSSYDYKSNLTITGTEPNEVATFKGYTYKSAENVKVEIPYISKALYDLTLNLTDTNLDELSSGVKVKVYKGTVNDENLLTFNSSKVASVETGTKLIVLVKPKTGYDAVVQLGGDDQALSASAAVSGAVQTDGTFTMDGKYTLKVTATPQTFTLTAPTVQNYTYTVKSGLKDDKVTYGTDFVFTVVPNAGYSITSVQYKVGTAESLTALEATSARTYTLDGNKISGAVTIIVTVDDAEYTFSIGNTNATTTTVTGILSSMAKHGTDIVIKPVADANFNITTVTATVGGKPVTLTHQEAADSAGTWTLSGSDITGNVEVQVGTQAKPQS